MHPTLKNLSAPLYSSSTSNSSASVLERQLADARKDVQMHVIELRVIEREIDDFFTSYSAYLEPLFIRLRELERQLSNQLGERLNARQRWNLFVERELQLFSRKLSQLLGYRHGIEAEEILRLIQRVNHAGSFIQNFELEQAMLNSPTPLQETAEARRLRLGTEYENILMLSTKLSIWKRELMNSPAYLLHQCIQYNNAAGRDIVDFLRTHLQKQIRQREKLLSRLHVAPVTLLPLSRYSIL